MCITFFDFSYVESVVHMLHFWDDKSHLIIMIWFYFCLRLVSSIDKGYWPVVLFLVISLYFLLELVGSLYFGICAFHLDCLIYSCTIVHNIHACIPFRMWSCHPSSASKFPNSHSMAWCSGSLLAHNY